MGLGEEFLLSGGPEDWIFKVLPFPLAIADAEAALAEQAAFTLRFGLTSLDPSVFAFAQEVERALLGDVAQIGREPLARSSSDPGVGSERVADGLLALITNELRRGRIVVERRKISSLSVREEESAPELPPLPPPAPEGPETFFEVRFVDEIGQAVGSAPVALDLDSDSHDLSTNAAGVALLENVVSGGGSVRVDDASAFDTALDQRWTAPRSGNPPREGNTLQLTFTSAPIGPFPVKPAVPNTIVLAPPLGKIWLRLLDKSGRVPYRNQAYTIEGPETLSGETDDAGVLEHTDVFPGDYQLSLSVETTFGDETTTDDFATPVLVLAADAPEPQVRRLGPAPRCTLVRLTGPMFETNKSFLLPPAIDRLGRLNAIYRDNSPGELLIVGHTDTQGKPALNDPLSLERADNVAAFLRDDVDTWLAMFETGVPEGRRWGTQEDALMLQALPDVNTKPKSEALVRWFQRTRELSVDGIAGPQTRRQLVTEYMALDAAHLDEDELGIPITTHGAGENFPLDESGEALDSAPADQKDDAADRRVELFFFDSEFGILPPPPSKNSAAGSSEYPAWRARVDETDEIGVGVGAAADCEIDVALELPNGSALASRPCKLHVDGKPVPLSTDASGKLFLDNLPPDDYLLELDAFRQFVTAVRRGQGTRTVCLVSRNVPQAG